MPRVLHMVHAIRALRSPRVKTALMPDDTYRLKHRRPDHAHGICEQPI